MIAALLHFLDRHRGWTQAAAWMLFAAAFYCFTRLEVSDAPERWMPRSTLDAWQVFEEHFDAGDNLGVALHFRRPITEEDLPRLKALREELQAIEGFRQVYDCSLVAEQIEQTPLTELLDPANARRFDVYNGALWDTPQPGDPTRTLMIVCELVFHAGEDKTDPDGLNTRRRHVASEVERIVAEEKSSGDWQQVDFHVASSITMMREMEKRTRQVAYTFLPASILVGLTSLLFAFRSLPSVAIAVIGGIWAMVLVLGCVSALGGSLGVVTIATPTLMSVIAIASTVHFAAHQMEPRDDDATESSLAAGDRLSADEIATEKDTIRRRKRWQLVRWVAVPCCGSAITTGVGFLMLAFNELEPIRELGFQMFAGSLLAFLGVFLVTQWVAIPRTYPGHWLKAAGLGKLAVAFTTRPRGLVLAFLSLVGLLVFFAWPRPKDETFGLYVDADPFSFFSADQPIKVALDHFERRKFAVYQLEVILVPKVPTPAPLLRSAASPAYEENMAIAREFSAKVSSRADLGALRTLSTLSFRDRFQQLLERFSHGSPISESQLNGPQLEHAMALNQTFQAWNTDKRAEGAMRFTFVALNGPQGFAPLVEFVESQLPTEQFNCHMAGSVMQNVDLSRGLGKGMVYGLGSSFLVMGLVCVGLFKSLRLATLAILPNLFPVLFIFGVMGAAKIPISSGSAMVATIALGIALNDTIHFMLHYRMRTRMQGMPIQEAVNETLAHLGRPLVWTSLVHMAGFAIFLLTDFIPLFQFGLLSSIAMFAALIGDLVLLPNLLLVFDRQPRE